jgi:hypothetical protein
MTYPASGSVHVRLELRTRNPNNGATGNSRLAAIIRASRRRVERRRAHAALVGVALPPAPWRVTVTRVAPSSGLDPHDGLGAALKGVIDGVADGLGLRSDRDPVVSWVLDQRRGARGEYAVEVTIVSR